MVSVISSNEQSLLLKLCQSSLLAYWSNTSTNTFAATGLSCLALGLIAVF